MQPNDQLDDEEKLKLLSDKQINDGFNVDGLDGEAEGQDLEKLAKALRFWNHPAVQSISTEAKLDYLKAKQGLTQDEIYSLWEQLTTIRATTVAAQSNDQHESTFTRQMQQQQQQYSPQYHQIENNNPIVPYHHQQQQKDDPATTTSTTNIPAVLAVGSFIGLAVAAGVRWLNGGDFILLPPPTMTSPKTHKQVLVLQDQEIVFEEDDDDDDDDEEEGDNESDQQQKNHALKEQLERLMRQIEASNKRLDQLYQQQSHQETKRLTDESMSALLQTTVKSTTSTTETTANAKTNSIVENTSNQVLSRLEAIQSLLCSKDVPSHPKLVDALQQVKDCLQDLKNNPVEKANCIENDKNKKSIEATPGMKNEFNANNIKPSPQIPSPEKKDDSTSTFVDTIVTVPVSDPNPLSPKLLPNQEETNASTIEEIVPASQPKTNSAPTTTSTAKSATLNTETTTSLPLPENTMMSTSVVSTLASLLERVVKDNDLERLQQGCPVLFLYLHHLHTHPHVPRYQKIYASAQNESFQKVQALEGSLELLEFLGFQQQEGNGKNASYLEWQQQQDENRQEQLALAVAGLAVMKQSKFYKQNETSQENKKQHLQKAVLEALVMAQASS